MYVLQTALNCVGTSSFATPFAHKAICGEEYEKRKLDIVAGYRGASRQVYAKIKEIECRDFIESVLTAYSNDSHQTMAEDTSHE